MDKLDITSLTGKQLFAALASGKKFKTQTTAIPARPKILWKPNALVLIVHHAECSCGKVYSYPNTHVLLRRTHPTEGVHLSAIEGAYDNPGPMFRDLPLEIENREPEQLTQCQFCWDIEAIIIKATKEAK